MLTVGRLVRTPVLGGVVTCVVCITAHLEPETYRSFVSLASTPNYEALYVCTQQSTYSQFVRRSPNMGFLLDIILTQRGCGWMAKDREQRASNGTRFCTGNSVKELVARR